MTAAPGRVGRMNYENFQDVTLRHKVVPVNWPVTFKPPSKLTVLELHSLHTALYSDNPPVLFRKLTNAEWAASEQDIADGTSDYLVPPFRSNAGPMPTPLLLTGVPDPTTPTPPDAPSHDTPPNDTPSETAAPTTQPAATDQSSLPGSLSPDVSSNPPVPGPRGGAVILFDGMTAKAPRKPKGKKKTAAEKQAEKAAKKRAQAIEKAAAKEAAKAAKAAAKKASAAAKKSGAKKGGAKKGGAKDSGKTASNVELSNGSEGNVLA